MAGKTKKSALSDALEDLSSEELEKFRHKLLDRREEPRVRRNRVDRKNFLEITDVLVSTFTEDGAVRITVDILKQIGCSQLAVELEKDTGGPSPTPGSSNNVTSSSGTTGAAPAGEHFVDRHKLELINRVSNIASILDELYDKKVIQGDEAYGDIKALATSQAKVRRLYDTCLRASQKCKDIFYESLEKNEKFLIDDLKGK